MTGPQPHDPAVPAVPGPAVPGPAGPEADAPAPSGVDAGAAPAPVPVEQARVVLYGRAGCHLCDEARAVVVRVCAATGAPWAEVDVDVPGPDGRVLADELGELVPVVDVDGVRRGFWRVDENRLLRALAAAPPRP